MRAQGNLLIVEDSPLLSRMLVVILTTEGYAVRSAADGEQGLALFRAEPPDLVLMDICLPGIDGLEVCRRIKAFDKGGDVPIIFLSGLSEVTQRIEALHSGAVDYICKPFEPEELLVRVRTHIDLRLAMSKLEVQQVELLAKNERLAADDLWRKNVEEQLRAITENARASAEQFHAIFEGAAEGILVADVETRRFVLTNPRIGHILGYAPGELIGIGIEQIHPAESFPAIQAEFDAMTRGEKTISSGIPCLRKDGHSINADISTAIIELGGRKCLVGMFTDVTERKQAEVALLASEQRYRDLFDSSVMGIALHEILLDDNGIPCDYRFLQVNRAFELLTGLRADSIIGHSVLEVLPGTEPFWIDNYGRVALTGKPEEFESHSVALNKHFLVKAYSPAPRQFVAVFADVTDQKLLEKEQKANQIRLESLLRISQLHAGSIQELVDYAMHEAILLTDSKLGYCYMYDEEKREFTLNSWSTEVMKECTIPNPPTVYQLEKTGIWGEAIRQRQPILVNDFDASNPLKKGYPEGHSLLHRYLTIPVFYAKKIVAVLAVANKVEEYTQGDVGQLNLLMESVWNLVEKRRVDLILEKRKKILEKAEEIAKLGSWEWDIINGNVWWSDELYVLYGLDPAKYALRERSILELLVPDQRARWQEAVENALNGIKPLDEEFELLRPDGSQINIHTRGQVIRDKKGAPTGMFGNVQDITDRKRVEKLLQESEYFFRESQRAAFIGSYTTDFIAGFWTSSEVLDQIFGIDRDYSKSIEGWLDIVHPDDRSMMDSYLREEVIGRRQPFNKEYRILRKSDGATRWVLGLGQVTFDKDSRITSMIGTIQDITDRKQVEGAVHDREVFFRSVLENSTDLVVILNRAGRITYATPSLQKRLNWDLRDVVDHSFFDFIHPDDQSRIRSLFSLLVNDPDLRIMEVIRVINRIGEWRHVEGTCANLLDNPAVGGIVINYRDITARKQAEDALRKSEELFRTYLGVVESMVLVLDCQGRVSMINRKGCELLGWSAEELVGQDWMEKCIPAYTFETLRIKHLSILNGENPQPDYFENLVLTKGGQERLFAWRNVLLKDDLGVIAGTISAAEDITDRRAAEQALLTSREDLRALARNLQTIREEERTRLAREIHDVLAQNLTRLKFDLAWFEKKLTEMDQILPIQPLAVRITLMDQMVSETIRAVKRIATELRPAVLDSLGLCAAVEWQVQDFQTHSGIVCNTNVPPTELALSRECANALFRILQESLTNVLRHSQATSVSIDLHVEGDQLVFSIEDNGNGFLMEQLGKQTTFGLVGMKERVLLLSGQLDIQSFPGSGTRIEVRLPYANSTETKGGQL